MRQGDNQNETVRKWGNAGIALGTGSLMAVWFALFHRSSFIMESVSLEFAESFATGMCAGALLCGLALGFLCMKDSYRERCLGADKPSLFYAVLFMGTFAMVAGSFVFSLSGLSETIYVNLPFRFSRGINVLGAVSGFGVCLLLSLQLDVLARKPICDQARLFALAQVCFAVFHMIGLMANGFFALIYFSVLSSCAVLGLLIARLQADAPDSTRDAEPKATRTSIPARMLSFVRSSWRLVVVAAICSFMLGYNWNPQSVSLVQTERLILIVEESCGSLGSAALFFAFFRIRSNSDALMDRVPICGVSRVVTEESLSTLVA